jgi:hypothetical protein
MIVVFSIITALGVLAGGLTVFCGVRMGRLRSYGLVMAAIIINFIVALMVCPVLMVFGIWPMIVLLDARVRAHFGR